MDLDRFRGIDFTVELDDAKSSGLEMLEMQISHFRILEKVLSDEQIKRMSQMRWKND